MKSNREHEKILRGYVKGKEDGKQRGNHGRIGVGILNYRGLNGGRRCT